MRICVVAGKEKFECAFFLYELRCYDFIIGLW
jgi:hypothetical protein